MLRFVISRANSSFVFHIAAGLFLAAALGCASGRKQRGTEDSGARGEATGKTPARQSQDTMEGRDARSGTAAAARVFIGRYMDAQAANLAGTEGVRAKRFGDEILLTLDSGALFDFDSAMLKRQPQDHIGKVGEILVEYADTDIIVSGHTDNVGSETHNHRLSERRARSVRAHLVDIGVAPQRLTAVGYGELKPVASNESDAGRRLNRRVEIRILANAALRARAAEAIERER
jgi:outer membrane protein OmpA-like peptidoglycan-associated protein